MTWTIIAYFLISICENIEGKNPSDEKTWSQALQFCRNNNSNLISDVRDVVDKVEGSFWTGNLYRISDWIHILGCYNQTVFEETPIRVLLQTESVGRCQEYCRFRNLTHFAVKMNICACIEEHNVPSTAKLSSRYCTHECLDDDDDRLFNDCGGLDTYNVYKWSDMKVVNGNGHCLCIACHGQNILKASKCTTDYLKVCETKQTSEKSIPFGANFTGWNKSMKVCKTYDEYLLGNLNLSDKNSSCQAVKSIIRKDSEQWIGVAKEEYKTVDIGQVINEDSITQVEVCSDGNCSFHPFRKQDRHNVMCSKNELPQVPTTPLVPGMTSPVTDITPPVTGITTPRTCSKTTTSTRLTTPTTSKATRSSTTAEVQNTYTTTNYSYEKEHLDDQPVTTVAVAVSVVLVVCVGAAFVVILLLLRKRKLKADTSKKRSNKKENDLDKHIDGNLNYTMPNKHSKSQETNRKEYEEANNAYFVLEPAADCYELADNCILEQENPYTDGEEGAYDQLRNTKVRKREEEDTYQHATLTDIAETSDYDTSGHMRRQDIDSTYDHANANVVALESDNTYNSLENV